MFNHIFHALWTFIILQFFLPVSIRVLLVKCYQNAAEEIAEQNKKENNKKKNDVEIYTVWAECVNVYMQPKSKAI